jgi:hypothetical protein
VDEAAGGFLVAIVPMLRRMMGMPVLEELMPLIIKYSTRLTCKYN